MQGRSTDDMLGIGQLARLAGLSVGALRHNDEVGAVIAEDDPAVRRALLARHRDPVATRVTPLQRVLHRLTHLVDPDQGHDHSPEEHVMSQTTTGSLDAGPQTALAKALYNRVWEPLEKSDRTAADDEELVHTAHASRHFWTAVGTEKNEALARAYAVAGDKAAAVEWKAKAVARLAEVDDTDDREIVAGDLTTLPV
ncbi:hypothetical protein [Longivirga aurantiaca]|uniref:Uncharacterized protein n=1 Tax=Longivirga aurantiaca TaxID=1837743 RepID=A0ABW1T2C5_9ACTN